jgi:hypothetical protein
LDDADFEAIGANFGQEEKLIQHGYVACAETQLFPQPALVDYAVAWMERNRK